jgi:hypothetical protein
VKRPFLLQLQLMLRPTMDTLSSQDVGARLVSPDAPNRGAVAR